MSDRPLRCRIGIHSWETVGAMAMLWPVDECRRCGWFRVFSGFAGTAIYPPGSITHLPGGRGGGDE